jgi:hypothetical protein
MDDIEDRANKWAEEYISHWDMPESYDKWKDSLIAAYLAGSSQTQADYVAHYEGARIKSHGVN